jgi:hypothetical protein
VANPSTQKGLLQLAVAIAGTELQPAVVHTLSLIELEEDYALESTPYEAERIIQARRTRMEELIQSLEPPETRQQVHLPSSVRDRIDIQIVGSAEPIQAMVQASEIVDLTIAGTSSAWGIERQLVGQITLNSIPEPAEFTAQQESLEEKPGNTH